ncbi:MAG: carboxypeptidase-like regulatory domain-containing protein, partial [Bacteroides sp.]|nr:carboxypeptidase-like regulatory domain-containing protein [Bacteroides sp.]
MKKRNVRLGRVLLLAALFFLGIGIGTAKAQQVKVQGKVSDANGSLVGGSVLVEGTATGGITNADGEFQLSLNPGKYTLRASFVGYSTQKKTIQVLAGKPLKVDFVLNELLELDEVVVLGSRAAPRSRLETAVAVDVIDTKLLKDIPQVNLNQILHYLAPSFNSSTQTISDGTDHIDPASLRGLGPDQVLVLINGKRRHTTSLININGTAGKGSVGTDLNAIPTSAIKRIE